MTDAVFPVLPGLKWSGSKSPIWSTAVQQSTSGCEVRAALYANPLWKFSLSYEFLRDDASQELQQIIGLFNRCKGQFRPFLYRDPTDCTVTDQRFGTGNGVQRTFQLVRSIGGFAEPVAAVAGTPLILAGGSAVTGFSIDGGTVTFASPPSGALSWSGEFYYRCRFLEDTLTFENFLYRLWELKSLEFRSVR